VTAPLDACRVDGPDVLLTVRAQPGARQPGPVGTRVVPSSHGGPARAAVVWRIAAPAVAGRANAALCRAVATAVGVAPAAVAVDRGGSARTKVLRIRGTTPARVAEGIAAAGG
jgi:uncharacterized protein YggU (UPF0235/DUF167 family)